MNDGQTLRRDTDVLYTFPSADKKARANQFDQRRLSPRNARVFGITKTYDKGEQAAPLTHVLLTGLGAALATITLFVTVGALAIPSAAFA